MNGIILAFIAVYLAGIVTGVMVIRYGLSLGEKMAYGSKDGTPVLSTYDSPLEHDHSGVEES